MFRNMPVRHTAVQALKVEEGRRMEGKAVAALMSVEGRDRGDEAERESNQWLQR